MSKEQACLLLGVDLKDAERAVDATYPPWRVWSAQEMLDAMFAFHKEHGRFPRRAEYKLANNLPPRDQWLWRGPSTLGDSRIRAWDAWERLIARDRRCTPQIAITLRNVLARKEAIDRIGFQTFIKRGLATVRDEHPEYGTLYELPGETESEPMVLLKVVNSTPEPDGTFADYYLRVPPDQTNVREALTWTFNGNEALGSQPYEPLVQT
jgi:hypothetical protein